MSCHSPGGFYLFVKLVYLFFVHLFYFAGRGAEGDLQSRQRSNVHNDVMQGCHTPFNCRPHQHNGYSKGTIVSVRLYKRI